MYVFSDCSYSGQWVVDCAKYLDEMGIGACGHQAIKHGILLKISTSCQPSQKATLGSYIGQKGVYFNEKDHKVHFRINKKFSDTQTTYGHDFTMIKCLQLEGPRASCRVPDIPAICSWKWEDITYLEWENRPVSLIYTVRGTDRGWDAFHLVLVARTLFKDFKEKIRLGSINVADYGYVIESGWGKDPPDEIIKKLNCYCPSYIIKFFKSLSPN